MMELGVRFIYSKVSSTTSQSLYTMSIYVLPIPEPQIRRLYFRNLSITDIVVKLISTAPNVFELARNRLRLEPSSYLFIEAKFLYANLGIFDSPKLIGYAMPVYSHTLPMIGKWLNSDGMETKRQLAFEMPVCFSSKVFSARDVIIDLPGTACLVDSVPRPIPSSNGDSPVDEADADTKTAVLFTMDKDVVCNVSDTAENRGCWLTDLISSNYTAISTKMSSASQSESRSTLRTAKLKSSHSATNFSKLVASERADVNVNVEQEATPCGGN